MFGTFYLVQSPENKGQTVFGNQKLTTKTYTNNNKKIKGVM